MVRPGKWLLAAAWLTAIGVASSPSRAQAPSPAQPRTEAELATARKSFAEALRDQKEQRFEAALDGFRRARDVRDAAPVEYRIGMCLEELGRLPEALSAYDAAVRLSEGDPSAADVASASRDRIGALSRRVAHLILTLSPHAPRDSEVRVDGNISHAGDIVLSPGSHRVAATSAGATPFQTELFLPEGGRISLTVPLDPPVAVPPSPPPPIADEAKPSADRGSTRTLGWIGIAAGSALVAGSVASFVLRESDIRTANRDCPGGGCVGAIDGDALSATSRARIEGPLGFGLGAAGVVAVGAGVYFVLSASKHAPAISIVPTAGPTGAGFALRGVL